MNWRWLIAPVVPVWPDRTIAACMTGVLVFASSFLWKEYGALGAGLAGGISFCISAAATRFIMNPSKNRFENDEEK